VAAARRKKACAILSPRKEREGNLAGRLIPPALKREGGEHPVIASRESQRSSAFPLETRGENRELAAVLVSTHGNFEGKGGGCPSLADMST